MVPADGKFNQSPVFLEFLKGNWDLECRPWGDAVVQSFWMAENHVYFAWTRDMLKVLRTLMNSTDWNSYGRASGNPKCQQCMAHCGYEPAAVEATFGSWKGFLRTARLAVFGPPRDQDESAPSLPENAAGRSTSDAPPSLIRYQRRPLPRKRFC